MTLEDYELKSAKGKGDVQEKPGVSNKMSLPSEAAQGVMNFPSNNVCLHMQVHQPGILTWAQVLSVFISSQSPPMLL